MPFDLVGWSEAAPGNAAVVGVAGGLNDTLYTVLNDQIKVKPELSLLLGLSYAAESTPGYCLLRQTSLPVDQYFIKGCDLNDNDQSQGYKHLFDRPLPLFPEYLTALEYNATDEDVLIGAMLGSGRITQAQIEGVVPDYYIRGTIDQAAVANTWTQGVVAYNQDLPEGTYAIVGMIAFTYKAAAPMAALIRLVLSGRVNRPGVPANIGEGDKLQNMSTTPELWSKWPLMREISFNTDNYPAVEILCPEANTDHVIELAVKKIG